MVEPWQVQSTVEHKVKKVAKRDRDPTRRTRILVAQALTVSVIAPGKEGVALARRDYPSV
jgi:hypothetical protein